MAIIRLATRQAHLIATWQLRELDIDRSAVARRVRTGLLRRVASNVHATVGAPTVLGDRELRWLAVLHAGPNPAALARGTAAAQLGLLHRGDERIHVVSTVSCRPVPGRRITYHRVGDHDLVDRPRANGGPPTTTVTRTLLDG